MLDKDNLNGSKTIIKDSVFQVEKFGAFLQY